jgi:hypothetical protein
LNRAGGDIHAGFLVANKQTIGDGLIGLVHDYGCQAVIAIHK